MIVSICFTWFPIGSLGRLNIYHQSNIYHQLDFYTRTANFTWRVSDCEVLVGVVDVFYFEFVILLNLFDVPVVLQIQVIPF